MNEKTLLPRWLKFYESFQKFIVKDLEKALSAELEVGTIVLTVIGIECLSGYLAGKKSDRNTFVKFVERFMPAYSHIGDDIYTCIRNGLAHDYIIQENVSGKSFVFTRDVGEKHLELVPTKSGWYYLNREEFATDFIRAQQKYFDRVTKDEVLYQKAIRRLNQRSFLDELFVTTKSIFVNTDSINGEEYDGVTGAYPRKI